MRKASPNPPVGKHPEPTIKEPKEEAVRRLTPNSELYRILTSSESADAPYKKAAYEEFRFRTGIGVQKLDRKQFTVATVPFSIENLAEIKEYVDSKLALLPDVNIDERGGVRQRRVNVSFVITKSSEELLGKNYGLLELKTDVWRCQGETDNYYPETTAAIASIALEMLSKHGAGKALDGEALESLKAEFMSELTSNSGRK